MGNSHRRYNPLSDFLKSKFGCKVFKISVNTGLTCPNRDGKKGYGGCIYCESSTLEPKARREGADVAAQLSEGAALVGKRHRAGKFIAYFQINTNTYGPPGRLNEFYRQALGHPDVVGIAVSTRPDCLDDDILDVLASIKKERYLWVELGLQSSNGSTLKAINRGHTAADFIDANRRAKKRGLEVCAHVILGLPGEGREEALETMRFLGREGVWGVKFHQLQVIRGTRLEEMYLRGEVRTLSLEEYAHLVVECLEELPPEAVIHRLSGDAPERYIVAPRWSANKFMIMERISGVMAGRASFQGARWRPGP